MRKAAYLLLLLGVLQMAGDLLRVPALKGIGAASGASPAPRVFSAVNGLETYSTRFRLEWIDASGEPQKLELTPELYSRLRGPYNRRNVYGAALAYGPVLATEMRTLGLFQSVVSYGLCGEAPVLRELGIDPDSVAGEVRVHYEPVSTAGMGELPRVLDVGCP